MTRSLRTDGQDTYTLTPSDAPDHATRAILADRSRRLGGWLTAAGGDEARPFVAGMLGSYPARQEEDEDVSAKITAYCVAVGQLPLWAISEVCAMALRGHIGRSEGRFAPTPGELCLAGERLLESVIREKRQLTKILTAQVVEPEYIAPERRKEIAAGACQLLRDALRAATDMNREPLENPTSAPLMSDSVRLSPEALKIFESGCEFARCEAKE